MHALQDVGEGLKVQDAKTCLTKCDDTPECNAVSYYSKPKGGNNCFLKTLHVPCTLPGDASDDDDTATLYLKCQYRRTHGVDYIRKSAKGGPEKNDVEVTVCCFSIQGIAHILEGSCVCGFLSHCCTELRHY